ncbi:DUF6194 family protein [Microbacterium sp. B2969]|uniref:DUF6194 family protein n=1 Tax=Microbacterium alkaliflavum TaxID=3248839 RepID=A0ABW7Q374_9MICO
MEMRELVETVRAFEGILVLAPEEGGPFPEIAWGDSFFYFAPGGEVPANTQPFTTIVTKDYPDDTASRLGDGRWRVNVHVGSELFRELIGSSPKDAVSVDHAEADAILPHPVYAALGWVSVVNPAERTSAQVLDLVRSAYYDAVRRADRRRSADAG